MKSTKRYAYTCMFTLKHTKTEKGQEGEPREIIKRKGRWEETLCGEAKYVSLN